MKDKNIELYCIGDGIMGEQNYRAFKNPDSVLYRWNKII